MTLVYGLQYLSHLFPLWATTKRVLLIFASGTIPCILITNGMVHTGEIATMIIPILMIGNILHLTVTGKNFLHVGAGLRFAGATLQFDIDVIETRDLRIAGATDMLILRLPIESLYRVTQDHMIKATGHQDRLDIVLGSPAVFEPPAFTGGYISGKDVCRSYIYRGHGFGYR